MFLEPISILILTMPILLQLQKVIAMDLVQFGTMVVLNVVIGMARRRSASASSSYAQHLVSR